MLRLSPSGENRLVTGKSLDVHLGGAEMNVVTGASLLGMKTALLSKFPGNLFYHQLPASLHRNRTFQPLRPADHPDRPVSERAGWYYKSKILQNQDRI